MSSLLIVKINFLLLIIGKVFRRQPKGEKADSVYPGYGNNPHNPENTMAIQPILSRYIRYVTDTEDIVSLGSRSYPLDSLDLHRISWILWIFTVSSGFSRFPIYRSDPHRIPDMKIRNEFSGPEYGADPEDTSGIQRIRRIRWNP